MASRRAAGGVRVYAAHQHRASALDAVARRGRIDALVDVAVRLYAPLPASSLSYFVRRLRFAVPQWRHELKTALERARERLSHARLEGVDWYWPAAERSGHLSWDDASPETVRLLTPFDPVVHDRRRFELLWGWVYGFEAYTPEARRKLGYYALPLLWRDRVIGWGNLAVREGELRPEIGYVGAPPRNRAFRRELEAELDRMRTFLGLAS